METKKIETSNTMNMERFCYTLGKLLSKQYGVEITITPRLKKEGEK